MPRARTVLLPLAALVLGCGFPPKVLERRNGFGGRPMKEPPEVSEVPVRGFSVAVTHQGTDGEQETEGELLAVDRKFVWVLVEQKVRRVPLPDIARVSLELYPSRAGWYGLWSGIGTAAAASNGLFAVVSGPLWALTGTTTTTTAAMGNDIEVPLDRLDRLPQFARYPAGMPPPWRPRRRVAPAVPPPASRPASQPAPASRPAPASQPVERDEPGISPAR